MTGKLKFGKNGNFLFLEIKNDALFDESGRQVGYVKNGRVQITDVGIMKYLNPATSAGQHTPPPVPPKLIKKEEKEISGSPAKPITFSKKIILAIAGVLALTFAVAFVIFATASSKKNSDDSGAGEFSSRGFEIECTLSQSEPLIEGKIVCNKKIKDEEEKFVLLMTDPTGETKDIKVFLARYLAENHQDDTRRISFRASLKNPRPGKYTLTLKSFRDKDVVCRREVTLFLEEIAAKDVHCAFSFSHRAFDQKSYHVLNSLVVIIEKRGNLPVLLKQGVVTINDEHRECIIKEDDLTPDGVIMIQDKRNIVLEVKYAPNLGLDDKRTPKLKKGVHRIVVKIHYQGGFFTFEKDVEFSG